MKPRYKSICRPVRRYMLICSILTCLWKAGFTQWREADFQRYTVRDGLSDNEILSLAQDDQGYLWVGTDAGLNRFDGAGFRTFFQSTPPLHLPSGSIPRLKPIGPHRLGILTKGGVVALDTRRYTTQSYIVPDSTPFASQRNATWDISLLPGNKMAVTTASGFYVFSPQGEVQYRHDAYGLQDVGSKRILFGRDIFDVEESLRLIYIEETGLAIYDDASGTFQPLHDPEDGWNIFFHPLQDQQNYWVVRQQIDRDAFLFIAQHRDEIIYYHHPTRRKVVSPLPFHVQEALNWESKFCLINDSTLLINHRSKGFYILHLDRHTGLIRGDPALHLPTRKVISMLGDKDGRLWLGSTEGLFRQKLHAPLMKQYHYPPEGKSTYSGGISAFYRYKDLLFATRFSNDKGMTVIRATDMVRQQDVDFFAPGSPYNSIRSIEMYHPDTLWIGSNGGLLWYAIATGHYGKVLDETHYPWAHDFFPVLAPLRGDSTAWMVSMLNGKVARYHAPSRTFTLFTTTTRPAFPFEKVKNVVYDAYGDVWFSGHCLARWSEKAQRFDTLITTYGGANKFNDDIITMVADRDGSLWLHNRYNGLLEYKIREKQFVSYTMKEGLPSDVLQSLSPVINHRLWIGSNSHLTCFDTRTKKCIVFNDAAGFPDQRPTSRKMFFSSDGPLMYMGTQEYIVTFPPEPYAQTDYSSPLMIEEINVDNKRTYYQPQDPIPVQYGENSLQVYFTVIDFEEPHYQFSYRLHPSGTWNLIGDQRYFSLNHLPPGEYAVEVRASGKPGLDKTSRVHVVVRSPLWKRPWFILSLFLLVAGAGYWIVVQRIRYIRQRANVDKLLAQTEIRALQAQMNPHFIFNSLNSIGEMILNQENKEASHYLSKFARLIRITLDQSSQSMVSLRNTIDYLERYMEMEHIRNSHFTHVIRVDPALDQDETQVPPMLIQPFIENALWHGVSALRKDIHVEIRFDKSGENLICTIDDNGIGIHCAMQRKTSPAGRHQPVGITNIQQRVALLNEKYNLHGHISIVDKQDIPGLTTTGTRVTLQLPLEIEEV